MFRISWELKGRHHFRLAEDDGKSLDRSRADLEGEMVSSLQDQFDPDPSVSSDLQKATLQGVVHRAMVQYREHGLVWTNQPIPELFRQWSQVETEKSQPPPQAGLGGELPSGAREAGPTLDVPYYFRSSLPHPDAVGLPLDEFNLDCEEHLEALRKELQWQSKNRPETLSVWVEAVLSPIVDVEKKAFLSVEVLKGLLDSPEVSDDHLRSALRLSETEGHLKASLSLLKQTANCSKAPFKQLVDRVVHFVTSRVFNCCQQKVILALVSKWMECFATWPREARSYLSRRCSAPSISTRRPSRSLTYADSSPSFTDLPLPSSSALRTRSPPLSSNSSSTQSPNPRRSPVIGIPVLQERPPRPATTEPMVIEQDTLVGPDQEAGQIGQLVSVMGLAEGEERSALADLYEDPFQSVSAQAEEIVEMLSGLYQGMTVHALPPEQKEALQNYLLTTLSDFFDFGFGSIKLLHAWVQLGDRDEQGQLRNPLGMEDLQRVVQEVLRQGQGFVGWKEVGDFQYAGNLDHLILQMEWHRYQRPYSLLLATEAALSVSNQKGGGVAFLQSLLQALLAGDRGGCLGLGASIRSRIEVQLAAWKEPDGLPTDEGLFQELLGSIEIVVDRAIQQRATKGFGLKELVEMHLQLIPLFVWSPPAGWSNEFRGQIKQYLEVVVSSLNGLLDTTDVPYLRDQLYSLLAGKTKEQSGSAQASGLHGVRQAALLREQDLPRDCSDELFTALFEGASVLFQLAQRKYQQSAANSEGINEMTLNITTLLLIWSKRHPHSLAFSAAMERFRESVAAGWV